MDVTFYEKRLKPTIRRLMPRSVKPHRILAGPLRGRIIVTSWHDYPGAILGRTERALLEWFGRNVREGETWLDVGAHYGYTAIALSELVGSQGRVFAFEPVLSTAGYLGRTRAINHLAQLRVLPLGLGDSDVLEVRRVPVVRGMADSTLHPPDAWIEPCLVVGLDSLWSCTMALIASSSSTAWSLLGTHDLVRPSSRLPARRILRTSMTEAITSNLFQCLSLAG